MESLDALMLARIQFAFTISAHIVFPALSIGLASYLAVLNGLWLVSGREVYLSLFDLFFQATNLFYGFAFALKREA